MLRFSEHIREMTIKLTYLLEIRLSSVPLFKRGPFSDYLCNDKNPWG